MLTGVDAIQISAGGIGGAEGSVRLLLKGEAEQVRKAEELVENIQGEPPFLFMETINSGRQNITINGKRIYLRELNEEDASQEYCNWLNDPMVNKFLETKKATVEELKQYIKEKRENPDRLFFGIFLKDTNKHIGNIKLEPVDFENKEATLGILIGNKDYWGRGVCAEAVKLLAGHAFKNLNVEKIDLGVISENEAAIKCYLKAGFRINNIEQGAVKYDNMFYDKVIMSIEKQAMRS